MSSIKHKTIDSLKWSAAEKLGQFSIQLIISIVLARLLGPEQYAVIGILNIFISISVVLVDAGFSQGLIRKLNCEDKDYNAVFWFNLLMSIGIYGVLFFTMPAISRLFSEPDLVATGRVLMLIIPIQALNVVQTTIVNKDLDFKKIAKYTILVTPIAGTIGITLALMDYGVWALVWQTLSFTVLTVIAFWMTSRWKPSIRVSFEPIRELLGFSLKLSASAFLTSLFNNLYTFIVAKIYSPIQLGFYTQAQKYATMPTNLIESVLNRMTYPLLSNLQENKVEYRRLYISIQTMLFAGVAPLMVYLILCGEEGIILVLGEKWAPSVPFFEMLCLAGLTLPFHPLAIANLKVFGRSDIIFNLEILKKLLIVGLIIAFWPLGIMGLLASQVVFFWITLALNAYYGGKQINYRLRDQIGDVWKYAVLIAACFAVAVAFSWQIESMVLSLIIKSIIFAAGYIFGLYVIKLPAWKHLVSFYNKFVFKR